MRGIRVPAKWRLMILALAFLAGVAMFLPQDAESIDWGGEWMRTNYAASQDSVCNSAAGEICFELCYRNNGQIQGTGELCCSSSGNCQVQNVR